MKVERHGELGFIRDDKGKIVGLWTAKLEHAQLEDRFKPRLRAWLGLEEAQGNTVPLEVYEAAVSGKFRVVKCNYDIGGHFLVFDHLLST